MSASTAVRFFAACAMAVASACLLPACSGGGAAGRLEVTLVQRTEKLVYPGGTQTAAPTRATQDVLLVFKVAGVTWQDYQAIPRDRVYVAAGDSTSRARVIGHLDRKNLLGRVTSGSVSMFVSVPRTASRFTLHLGDRPPVTFEAPPAVLPSLALTK